MKHGFVGDLRDYAKLTLLRRLSDALTISVCWMLTPDDGGADGRRIEYLHNPRRYRPYDPDVWDFFCWTVWGRGRRHLSAVERSGLLPQGTRFYHRWLPASGDKRTTYFNRFFRNNRADLVFFDPDNGIEVGGVHWGWANSVKYVFWCEIERAWNAGYSVLIYQHIPHENREDFTQRIVGELMQHTGARTVYVFEAQAVSFLLVPQERHLAGIAEVLEGVGECWRGLMTVRRFPED